MAAAESALLPRAFLRISRFHIVNLNRVKTIEHWFRGQYRFILDNDTILIGTRGYRERILQVMERTSLSANRD